MHKAAKPRKPSPDFPLFAHSNGSWAKKINQKLEYFGSWKQGTEADPDGSASALRQYKAVMAKRQMPVPVQAVTVGVALNAFLNAKKAACEAGKIAQRTYLEHQRTCSRFAKMVHRDTLVDALSPQIFAEFMADRAKTLNIVSVGNEVTRVKTAFKWCYENRVIEEPVYFGSEFRKPPRKAVRRHRRESGKKLFTAKDIWKLLDEAGLHLRAMILLGINCGYGPHDCATLPLNAVDLDAGWIDYPRPKTEVDRRCPLWPETIDAMSASAARRPRQIEGKPVFFVQHNGKPFSNESSDLSKYFGAVRRRVLPDGGMYWLRHTLETIGGGAKDQVALNQIMGHVDDTMAAVYREDIDAARLRAVTNHVRNWMLK